MAPPVPMQVFSDRSLTVALLGAASTTVKNVGGDTVYYSTISDYVTPSSNQGSIALNGTATFTEQVWLRSATNSSVTVAYTGATQGIVDARLNSATSGQVPVRQSDGGWAPGSVATRQLSLSARRGVSGQTQAVCQLEDFGGSADGVTDNLAALNTALGLFTGNITLGGWQQNGVGIIELREGVYYFSDRLPLNVPVWLKGANGTFNQPISSILVAQDKPGIVIDKNLAGTAHNLGAKLSDLWVISNGSSTAKYAHGIVAKSRILAQNVQVENFGGDQWNLDCSSGWGQNGTFSRLSECYAYNGGGCGFYLANGNAGNCLMDHCGTLNAGLWARSEQVPGVGNTWIAFGSEAPYQARDMRAGGGSNFGYVDRYPLYWDVGSGDTTIKVENGFLTSLQAQIAAGQNNGGAIMIDNEWITFSSITLGVAFQNVTVHGTTLSIAYGTLNGCSRGAFGTSGATHAAQPYGAGDSIFNIIFLPASLRYLQSDGTAADFNSYSENDWSHFGSAAPNVSLVAPMAFDWATGFAPSGMLNANIGTGDTSIVLKEAYGVPSSGVGMIRNLEHIHWTGVSGSTLTGVTRGIDGTSAVSGGQNTPLCLPQAAGPTKLSQQCLEATYTISDSTLYATIPDPSIATIVDVTLTANWSPTFPSLAAGVSFELRVKQNGTGGFTVTWPVTVKWPGDATPTQSSAANAQDVYAFTCIDGAKWHGAVVGQNYSS